jgi:hypothetical protein
MIYMVYFGVVWCEVARSGLVCSVVRYGVVYSIPWSVHAFMYNLRCALNIAQLFRRSQTERYGRKRSYYYTP